MKKFYLSIMALLYFCRLQAFAQNQPLTAKEGENWIIKWNRSDDFNGTSLDWKRWNPNVANVGVWSWDNDNISVSDGTAKITVTQETHTRVFWDGCNRKQVQNFELYYKSGIIKSFATGTYGYYEAKIKGADLFPGVCPAFWLYSPIDRTLTKPGDVQYSEIDIVEMQQGDTDHGFGNDPKGMEHNLHTIVVDANGKPQWHRPKAYPEENMNLYEAPFDPRDGFHVYGCEVTKEKITWYVDGVKVGEKKNLYWHRPMNVTFSVGMRRHFTEFKCNQFYPNKASTTKVGFPTTMEIDYIRVWEKEEGSVTPTPVAPTGVTVSPSTSTLKIGGNLKLNTTVLPSNASNKNVRWESSNTDVASVSQDGIVSAKQAGSATISVFTIEGNKTASASITVVASETETPNPPTPSGVYYLVNKHKGQKLKSLNAQENATIIYTLSGETTTDLMWEKIETTSDYFRLKNSQTAFYLSAPNAQSNDVLTQSAVEDSSTEWKLISAGGDYFYLQNKATGNYFRPHAKKNVVIERPSSVTNYSTQWQLVTTNSNARIMGTENYLQAKNITNIELYPNPTSDKITLDGLENKSYQLTVLNAQGLTVDTFEVTDVERYVLSVNTYATGIYFLSLHNEEGSITFKFIKE